MADGLDAEFSRLIPSVVAFILKGFVVCIAHSRMPVNHRRAIRMINPLELLFVEARHRRKIIPHA